MIILKSEKKEKGITLIALVITIIVLLILAGVTYNLTIGDRGIFSKAKQAKEEYETESLKEEIRLALLDKQLELSRELTEGEIKGLLGKYGDVEETDGKITLKPSGTTYEIAYEDIVNGETSQGSGRFFRRIRRRPYN